MCFHLANEYQILANGCQVLAYSHSVLVPVDVDSDPASDNAWEISVYLNSITIQRDI